MLLNTLKIQTPVILLLRNNYNIIVIIALRTKLMYKLSQACNLNSRYILQVYNLDSKKRHKQVIKRFQKDVRLAMHGKQRTETSVDILIDSTMHCPTLPSLHNVAASWLAEVSAAAIYVGTVM